MVGRRVLAQRVGGEPLRGVHLRHPPGGMTLDNLTDTDPGPLGRHRQVRRHQDRRRADGDLRVVRQRQHRHVRHAVQGEGRPGEGVRRDARPGRAEELTGRWRGSVWVRATHRQTVDRRSRSLLMSQPPDSGPPYPEQPCTAATRLRPAARVSGRRCTAARTEVPGAADRPGVRGPGARALRRRQRRDHPAARNTVNSLTESLDVTTSPSPPATEATPTTAGPAGQRRSGGRAGEAGWAAEADRPAVRRHRRRPSRPISPGCPARPTRSARVMARRPIATSW